MGQFFDQIPEPVQDHIRQITKTSGLGETDEAVEMISQAWLEKRQIFENRVKENHLDEVESYAPDEARGALLMTYSGSIISVGPLSNGSRNIEYASIGLRDDVPERAAHDEGRVGGEISVDSIAEFNPGPISKSSAIFMIAVPREEMELEEEEELLSNVTQVITEDFVEVNKTIIRG
jgi:ABC-type enterochelin transport system substrate-binding protein